MPPCRLIIDALPSSGAWNMAVDEALLESAVRHGECAVRIYRWKAATISVGYFQPADELEFYPQLADLPVVRRLSGGGAIVHHHEVTYSCLLPAAHPLAADPTALYGRVHAAIVALLAEHGITAALRGDVANDSDEPLLCFGRGDRHDIVVEGHKVVGSAQRRRRGAVLQHGSILLRRSEFAPDYPGLSDLARWPDPTVELEHQIGERIAAVLAATRFPGEFSASERELARELESSKYCHLAWVRRHEAAH
jgi:lipoate-protein ligase A